MIAAFQGLWSHCYMPEASYQSRPPFPGLYNLARATSDTGASEPRGSAPGEGSSASRLTGLLNRSRVNRNASGSPALTSTDNGSALSSGAANKSAMASAGQAKGPVHDGWLLWTRHGVSRGGTRSRPMDVDSQPGVRHSPRLQALWLVQHWTAVGNPVVAVPHDLL
jgi:hypothetical protein